MFGMFGITSISDLDIEIVDRSRALVQQRLTEGQLPTSDYEDAVHVVAFLASLDEVERIVLMNAAGRVHDGQV